MSSLNRRIRSFIYCSRVAVSRTIRSNSDNSAVCQFIAVPFRQLEMTFKTCSSLYRLFISFSLSIKTKMSRKVTCFSLTTRPSPSAPGLKKPMSSGRKGRGHPDGASAVGKGAAPPPPPGGGWSSGPPRSRDCSDLHCCSLKPVLLKLLLGSG